MLAHTRTTFLSLIVSAALLSTAASTTLPARAQTRSARELRPDVRRALSSFNSRRKTAQRAGAYQPQRSNNPAAVRRRTPRVETSRQRRPARPAPSRRKLSGTANDGAAHATSALSTISAGTPLSRVLHTSQLSLISSSGTHEQFVDRNRDLIADERTTFDAQGGSFDVAVGRSGARYEVFTAIDDRGTGTTSDDVATGVLVVALDTNGDYIRDTSATFDLGRDFGLPSAVAVVTGVSSSGREFVVVSSSGYFNFDDPNDPDNEESPGVVLLVRDPLTGGFDASLSRSLVSVGDDRLFNANALTLLPNNDLLIADFESDEIRVVRDTNNDRVPDNLASTPYYTFPFSATGEDSPLDIAANSRGVVFSHTIGNDSRMLAIYDDDADGFADVDEIVIEGLSIDNNLVLHGLTVGRDGTVYVIEDATGESDTPAEGGNGGIPHVYAFPDPALNGVLRDGDFFAFADDEFTQALSGLSFGVETTLAPVGHLTMTNSASLNGNATYGGLASIQGNGLTRGASGATQSEAASRGVRVSIEGLPAPVLSFNDSQIHIFIPASLGGGLGSVVVTVNHDVIAADDARVVNDNPGLFTIPRTGAGEVIALLVSGNFYTHGPFPATTDGQPSVIALFGTGWRNSLPVSVTIGGRTAAVQFAGASVFNGMDQINVVVPNDVSGPASVVVRTASGATSRGDVVLSVQ